MSSYIAAIAVDFGSTNSGCCLVSDHNDDGSLKYSSPTFIHSTGDYAKDATWFYISRAFLDRLIADFDAVPDSDFHIASRTIQSENPNIVWGKEAIKNYKSLIGSDDFVGFERFKMMLYHGNDTYAALDFPLISIIKIFLRVLKIECLARVSGLVERPVEASEIKWGLTIPTIWTDDNKRVMVRIAREVFTPQAHILSEPEGPLVWSLYNIAADGKVGFKEGRTSLVVDLGGGTTDICLLREANHGTEDNPDWCAEMVVNSDGSAAGGNDIDEAFYLYMLRDLTRDLKTDAGVAYDSLSDFDLREAILTPYFANIDNRILMEDAWLRIKNSRDIHSLPSVPFSFEASLRRWLLDNGHKAAAARLGEYLMDGCQYTTDDFIKKVFNPTFDNIVAKVKEILADAKTKTRIDRVVFAGGLSCNFLIKSRLQTAVYDVLGQDYDVQISDMGSLRAGGAISAGAAYQLVHKDFVQHLALRNFYYDISSSSPVDDLINAYAQRGVAMTAEMVKAGIEKEAEYKRAPWNFKTGRSSHVLLFPIAIKGQLIEKYTHEANTSSDQRRVSLEFFSSDSDFVFYSNQKNPKLRKEAEVIFEGEPSTTYIIEADFNEAAVSNAIHYTITNKATSAVVAEGLIEGAVS